MSMCHHAALRPRLLYSPSYSPYPVVSLYGVVSSMSRLEMKRGSQSTEVTAQLGSACASGVSLA
jgi:hypothetical protein